MGDVFGMMGRWACSGLDGGFSLSVLEGGETASQKPPLS